MTARSRRRGGRGHPPKQAARARPRPRPGLGAPAAVPRGDFHGHPPAGPSRGPPTNVQDRPREPEAAPTPLNGTSPSGAGGRPPGSRGGHKGRGHGAGDGPRPGAFGGRVDHPRLRVPAGPPVSRRASTQTLRGARRGGGGAPSEHLGNRGSDTGGDVGGGGTGGGVAAAVAEVTASTYAGGDVSADTRGTTDGAGGARVRGVWAGAAVQVGRHRGCPGRRRSGRRGGCRTTGARRSRGTTWRTTRASSAPTTACSPTPPCAAAARLPTDTRAGLIGRLLLSKGAVSIVPITPEGVPV